METEVRTKKEQIEAYREKVLETRVENADEILKYCSDIIECAEEINDEDALGFAYFYKGETYYTLNAVDEMFDTMVLALGHLNQSGQWRLVARAYNLMAITSVSQGNTVDALEYYMSGLHCCEEHDVKSVKGYIEVNLGYLYMDTGMYKEAKELFAKALREYKDTPEKNRNISTLIIVYTNLASCHMLDNELDKAKEYIDKLKTECAPSFENMDYIFVDGLFARYYHAVGDFATRDKYIDDVKKRLSDNVLIMDIFDDIYEFCLLMLDIDRTDVLQVIIDKLDEPIKKTRIVNLKRKFLTLKIYLYQKMGDRAGYVKATGDYFELSESLEKDKHKMVANILRVRNSLDRIRDRQRALEKETKKLLEKSETDQLTGIANRYRLTKFTQSALEKCRIEQIPLSYEVLDIDYFKQYNDEYGHQAGDECVKTIAGLLNDIQNDNVFCARYGGDEFVVIYVGLSIKEVASIAEGLRKRVYDLNMSHNGSREHSIVTISQGICHSIPNEDVKDRDFLHAADLLLYKVKRRSKNAVCIGDLLGEETDY